MTIKEIRKSSPTLQQLCVKAIREKVTTEDINDLVKKENFEKYVNLPESLKNKITKVPMFFKLGYEFIYEIPESGTFDHIHLDEDNNHVHLISKNDKKLTIFKMEEKKEINSFERDIFYFANNRSLMCWSSREPSKKIHLLENDTEYIINLPYAYGYPDKIFNNQRTLCLFMGRSKFLFDLYTRSLLINHYVKQIQFDINEKLCLVKYNKIFTLYNTEDPAKYKEIQSFNNIKNAIINPNGKNIFIKARDNKCAFISIEGKTLFEIEDNTHVHSVCFNDTGDYVVASHYNQKNGLQYNIINANNGGICFSIKLPIDSEVCFYKKFLVLVDKNDTAYLIRIKDLPMINNGLYTLDNIKKFNRVYSFENVDNIYCKNNKNKSYLFHPSGDYIITRKNGLWKLIHIKSKECVATFENVLTYHFSKPTGKMLYIEDGYRRWYKVFHCRNDFTLEEVLLNRLITKNNGDESIVAQYPHLQEIYTIDKDKQNFNILKPASLFTLKNVGIVFGMSIIFGMTLYYFSKKL